MKIIKRSSLVILFLAGFFFIGCDDGDDGMDSASLLAFMSGDSGIVVGAHYGGGIVAYIFQPGDPGYVDGETHGLIAATEDQSNSIQWHNGTMITTNATGTALGTGLANTDAIIAAQGATATDYAAGLARAYNGGGYSDWYLPSRDEMNKVWENRDLIGGFINSGPGLHYWTSSEQSYNQAYTILFTINGFVLASPKNKLCSVRVVRSF